jgi:hypothetical protein
MADKAKHVANMSTETMRMWVHKISEYDYVNRTMKRLNANLSPLADRKT